MPGAKALARLGRLARGCVGGPTPCSAAAWGVPGPATRGLCAEAPGDERAAKSVFVVHTDGKRSTAPVLIGLMSMLERVFPRVGYFQVIATPRQQQALPSACLKGGRESYLACELCPEDYGESTHRSRYASRFKSIGRCRSSTKCLHQPP